MGLTKSNLFSVDQNELAELAKCFSHPARIAILQYLLKSKECINSDLVKELGLAQATVSQHLRELKNVGIIKGTIDGVSMCYCIDEETWIKIKSIFTNLFDQHPCCNDGACC